MVQDLEATQQRLRRILYRFDCPAPLAIGEYAMDLLEEPERAEIAVTRVLEDQAVQHLPVVLHERKSVEDANRSRVPVEKLLPEFPSPSVALPVWLDWEVAKLLVPSLTHATKLPEFEVT